MAKQPVKRATAAEPDGAKVDAEVDDDATELPEAKVVTEDDREDPLRMVKLGGFAVILVVGWAFVILANHRHITAPVVFVCLAYLAILLTVVNLWRTGAAVADSHVVDDWQRPIGARGELLKEKKTLLKAIKEAEFDFAMGKLSKADSEALIRDYRARAIEVIKELDRGGSAQLSAREQIEAEVKARLALDAQNKPSNRAKNAAAKQAAKAAPKPEAAAKADSKPEAAAKAGEPEPEAEAPAAAAPQETLGDVVVQMAARGQLAMNRDDEDDSKPTGTGESS